MRLSLILLVALAAVATVALASEVHEASTASNRLTQLQHELLRKQYAEQFARDLKWYDKFLLFFGYKTVNVQQEEAKARLQAQQVETNRAQNKIDNELAHFTSLYRGSDGAAPQLTYWLLRRCKPFQVYVAQTEDKASTFKFFIQRGDFKADLTTQHLDADKKTVTLIHGSGTNCYKAAIGRFTLKATITKGGSNTEVEILPKVLFLFNPWSSDDDVFVPDWKDSDKKVGTPSIFENVMAESGAVYTDTDTGLQPTGFSYSHFALAQLEAILDLIESDMLAEDLSDVTLISRWMSFQINQKVLHGAWPAEDSGYKKTFDLVSAANSLVTDYKRPHEWNDVKDIIAAHRRNGNKRALFGQCWVFASVFTSLGRALGIPTRSMTNGPSAHEKRGPDGKFDQICNQKYVENDKGEFLRNDALGDVKMWNFHVWNDMWFKRHDITGGDGWQAVDATQQEYSSGGPNKAPFNRYTSTLAACGPASLAKLLQGDYAQNSKYDNDFIGGEANCVVQQWFQRKGQTTWEGPYIDKEIVGSKMMALGNPEFCGAKNPGEFCPANVNYLYNKPGTFLLETHANAKVPLGGKLSAPKVVTIGKDFSIEFKAAKSGKALEYSYTLTSITAERSEIISLLAHSKGNAKSTKVTFNAATFWDLPEVKKSLAISYYIEVVAFVSDGSESAINRSVIVATAAPKLTCPKTVEAGKTLTCSLELSGAATALSKVRATLSMSSQGTATTVVNLETLQPTKKGFKVDLSIAVDTPVKGRAIASFASAEWATATAYADVTVKAAKKK